MMQIFFSFCLFNEITIRALTPDPWHPTSSAWLPGHCCHRRHCQRRSHDGAKDAAEGDNLHGENPSGLLIKNRESLRRPLRLPDPSGQNAGSGSKHPGFTEYFISNTGRCMDRSGRKLRLVHRLSAKHEFTLCTLCNDGERRRKCSRFYWC